MLRLCAIVFCLAVLAPALAFGGGGGEWRALIDPKDGDSEPLAPMTTPRHGLGGAAKGDTVYAVEGGPSPGFAFSDELEALSLNP